MVRVLFLDIDGVICCNMRGELERDKLLLVKKICDATSAKVVLSSDWRRRPELRRRAEQTLAQLGVRCIGATPEYAMYSRVRPKEIVAWMDSCYEEIDGWCAIDDRDLILEEGAVRGGENLFSSHFVLTEFYSGLTTSLADKAIDRLLGGMERSRQQIERDLPPSPLRPRPTAAHAPAPASPRQPRVARLPGAADDELSPICSVRELLVDADLSHLEIALQGVTLQSMHEALAAPHGGGRVALLAHLRALGVSKISERQALANAFSKGQRLGRIGAPPTEEYAAASSMPSGGASAVRHAQGAPATTGDSYDDAVAERAPSYASAASRPNSTREWSDHPEQPHAHASAAPPPTMPPAPRATTSYPTSSESDLPDRRGSHGDASHLRGSFYAAAAAPSAGPDANGDGYAVPAFRPADERSVTISPPGSRVSVASGLMSLQPDATRACIVTHPHPGRGGDMYNAFVGSSVTALRLAGISTLRFNFSTPDGTGDNMEELLRTNVDELSAALQVLASASPQAAIVLVGYSWGAVVALATARKEMSRPGRGRVAALALFAPPINMIPASLHPGRGDFARFPMLLAAGERDEYCSVARLRQIAGDSATTLVALPGVDHFLHGNAAEQAASCVQQWVTALDVH